MQIVDIIQNIRQGKHSCLSQSSYHSTYTCNARCQVLEAQACALELRAQHAYIQLKTLLPVKTDILRFASFSILDEFLGNLQVQQ
jgi:hypothetical protein